MQSRGRRSTYHTQTLFSFFDYVYSGKLGYPAVSAVDGACWRIYIGAWHLVFHEPGGRRGEGRGLVWRRFRGGLEHAIQVFFFGFFST